MGAGREVIRRGRSVSTLYSIVTWNRILLSSQVLVFSILQHPTSEKQATTCLDSWVSHTIKVASNMDISLRDLRQTKYNLYHTLQPIRSAAPRAACTRPNVTTRDSSGMHPFSLQHPASHRIRNQHPSYHR